MITTNDLSTGIESLNYQRRAFQNWKTETLASFLEYKKSSVREDRLISFNGLGKEVQWTLPENRSCQLLPYLLTEEATIQARSGGYFASIQGHSFVLNPGKNFLERFCNQGLHLWDIDHVLITDSTQASSQDLVRIYTLNRKVNALLQQWNLPPHIIRYFLPCDTHTEFSHLLQPTCREERGCVEMLTIFNDKTYECLAIGDNLSLEYTTSCPKSSSIMVRFSSKQQPVLGFASQTYHQCDSTFLEECQTLLIGTGRVDLEGLTHEGLLGLLQRAQGQLTLLSEMDFSEGDMRIETVRALLEGLTSSKMAILPCEIGLQVNLSTGTIQTLGRTNPTPVSQIQVARSQGIFSPLQYLESSSVIHTQTG